MNSDVSSCHWKTHPRRLFRLLLPLDIHIVKLVEYIFFLWAGSAVQLLLRKNHIVHLQSKWRFTQDFICILWASTRYMSRWCHLGLVKGGMTHYFMHLIRLPHELFLAWPWVVFFVLILVGRWSERGLLLHYWPVPFDLWAEIRARHTLSYIKSDGSCFIQVYPTSIDQIMHSFELALLLEEPV